MNSSTIDSLLTLNSPYQLNKNDKHKVFTKELEELDSYHAKNCVDYKKITESENKSTYALPVRLFKLLDLKSVNQEHVFKVLTSSGTTSQVVSKINLDKQTAQLQTKVLVHIMQFYLGKKRLPMLIIDHPGVVKNRTTFSARGAGILGLSTFGRAHTYALNDDMCINFEAVTDFLEKHEGQDIFIFGFTFMVWQYFLEKLRNSNKKVDLSKAVLVHSGGWKKLQDKAVDNSTFKAELKKYCGIERVHNFYGMVEQVGSIYVECEQGHLHCPNFADIHFIDIETMESVPFGQQGIIVVESLIPRSYPGHRLLTEDQGYLIGEDDCPCGKHGKYFAVTGRLPKAEIRGCSDTHESK
jgi:phenylacetate-coenzyme A ligase PaaK-like adenylate-forming protein